MPRLLQGVLSFVLSISGETSMQVKVELSEEAVSTVRVVFLYCSTSTIYPINGEWAIWCLYLISLLHRVNVPTKLQLQLGYTSVQSSITTRKFDHFPFCVFYTCAHE